MMQRSLGVFFLFWVSVALVGCTPFTPYRTVTLGYVGSQVVAKEVACYSDTPVDTLAPCAHKDGAAAGTYAVQNRHYQFTDYRDDIDKTGELTPADYHMSFVEFDDQGWFADRKQMEALFALIHRLEREEKSRGGSGHILLMLYAHGWKHNASQCDDNVICFSRLLERIDILERKLQPAETRRRIVGVYVGWRGLSLDAGALSNLTFWTRKNTAARVGQGGVTELLARLNDYRASRNRSRDGDKTQLVITGHSFGGQVIYAALSHALMERAGRTIRVGNAQNCDDIDELQPSPDGLNCYSTATSFGDLVVLVNPAFEGSQYEPLFHIATNRCYRANQRPVMMTVTSRGDWATRIAFPLGRKVSTLFERSRSDAQEESIMRTVGHAERYETHKLTWLGPPADGGEEPEFVTQEGDCGCPYLAPTAQFNWRRFKGRVESFLLPLRARPEENPLVARREGARRHYDTVYGPHVRLSGDMKYSANYPYLVVKADKEIIEDHNTIYSEPFVRFLHSFFLVHIADRRPFESDGCTKGKDVEACALDGLVPCEQACRFADGRSCSGRDIGDICVNKKCVEPGVTANEPR